MSNIEFFGTLLNIWSVWLVARKRILNWPIGIAGTVLFGILFFQIHLYADFFEQIYFFLTGFWGWWAWTRGKSSSAGEKEIVWMGNRARTYWLLVSILGTIFLGYLTANLHIFFPHLFIEPASYPYLDAFTTVLSFVATILLIRKEIDAWYLWVLVDVIGIWLYWVKGIRLVSLLYVVFLILATNGLLQWMKTAKKESA